MKQQGLSFIISAPSGTGKTTICNILQKKMPNLKHAISHTTRAPRPTEKDGTDYYFISDPEFKTMIDLGDFLEWTVYHESYYGTSLKTIKMIGKDGNDTLLELDVQGAESLRKIQFPGIFILILPPSFKELGRRLRSRSTEPESLIQQRIEIGKVETAKYQIYDYVITNFELEDTVNDLLSIVQAENCRTDRYQPTSPDIEAILKQKIKT